LYKQGKGNPEGVYRWSHRWFTAQQAVAKTKADRIAAAEVHVTRMQALEKTAKKLVEVGMESPLAAHAASYFVAEAEVELALAKGE
jgi:hypothetical protein